MALYLYGSAVDGGLHPYSDIDLLAITDSVPSAAVRQALMTALLSVERGLARIRAAHPAARYELTRLKPRIIAALNRILGEGCVERVRIVSR